MKILAHYIAPQVLLIAVADTVLAAASLYLGYALVSAGGFGTAVPDGPALFARALMFALVVNAGMAAMGLYSAQQRYGIEGALARMLVGIGLSSIALALINFVFKFAESRLLWSFAFPLAAVLLGIARVVYARFLDDEVFRRRVLVYGAGKRAARILELRRRSDQRGFRIVGFLPAAGDTCVMEDPRVLRRALSFVGPRREREAAEIALAPMAAGSYAEEEQGAGNGSLLHCAREFGVHEIVVAVDDRRRSFPVAELLACKLAGLRVVDLLEFLERETGRVKVDMLNPAWLIFSDGFNRTGGERWSFRALDLLVAATFSLFALPVGLLVALAVLLCDGRPVLYKQRRVGLEGREFVLYKFRSMRQDAEVPGHARWAAREDARVTPVGRVLRKFRLDELPQLLNVFKGDMSFVGPRPERPEFVRELVCKIPYYHERHCVKPGLTGWAQLCYPYGASEEDARAKLEFDMYYVKNRSLVFNLMILLQTAEVVLWQKGSR